MKIRAWYHWIPIPSRPRARRRLLAFALATAGAAALAALGPPAQAQSNNPAPNWDPPYCQEQPRITMVYDNDVPLYSDNGKVILFSGANVQPCDLGYDGHSGWDYARSGEVQACGGGSRPGIARQLALAAAPGQVRRSRWYRSAHDGRSAGFGLHLDITYNAGSFGQLSHLYGHLAAVFVDEGQFVSKGQVIGAVGSTGNSSGPHLHFQGARGGRGDDSNQTFDIYGWNAAYGPGYIYPGYPQPHRGNSWPMRVITPGDSGPACPNECGGSSIVDDDDPSVTYGCRAGIGLANCPGWQSNPKGYDGGHHWVHPNGSARDHYVQYRCPNCGAGTYLVEAYVPMGSDIANTHVARYQVGDRVTVLDQHEEGDVWHPIGLFAFSGTPMVELSDRGDRYDYVAPSSQMIGADALRFRRISCSGGGGAEPPGATPEITPETTPVTTTEPPSLPTPD